MKRDLSYWKTRRADLREAIVDLLKAYRFAARKIRQIEDEILKPKEEGKKF